MPVWTHYFAHFVVTVIATIAFGITFQVPRRHYLAAGITGAVGWMVYIFGVELLGMSPAIATLVATLPLTGCARFFSITHKLFASKGGETFKVALALALGIALICSLPLPGGHEKIKRPSP